MADYRENERYRAAHRYAAIRPSDRFPLEGLAEALTQVKAGTFDDGQPLEHRYPYMFGKLQSAANGVLEMFGLDQDTPVELPRLTGEEIRPTINRLSREQRKDVLAVLAIEHPELFARIIGEWAPEALPERLRDGGAR